MLEFIKSNPFVIVIAVVVVLFVLFLLIGYEKAPSDKVFLFQDLEENQRF